MYIVTGGAGFIGSAFLAELNSCGIDDIIVVDRLSPERHAADNRDSVTAEKWKNLRNKRINDYIDMESFYPELDKNSLPKTIKAVIHLGANSSTTESDAGLMMRMNYSASRKLAEWALARDLPFIYASSAATYGDGGRGFSDSDEVTRTLIPLNVYAYSKQLFDCWALQSGAIKKMAGIKFFNVYGPNEYHKREMRSVVHKAFGQIQDVGKVRLFKSSHPDYADGEQERDFIYVKDCSRVLRWFLENPEQTGIFNLGTGKARSFNDLAKAVFTALDLPAAIEYIPMGEELALKYQNFTQAETGKLQAILGNSLEFHSLEDGVADYVKNYLKSSDPYL